MEKGFELNAANENAVPREPALRPFLWQVRLGMDHYKSDGGEGVGKNIHARENIKKKIRAKRKANKKFMQKEGPIANFI